MAAEVEQQATILNNDLLAPVDQKLDSAIHLIDRYPMDK